MATSVGLDVGGAHFKVARVEDGRVKAVELFACPLWKGLDQLHAAFACADRLTENADIIGITMTGELSDLFSDRASGVATLVSELQNKYNDSIKIWMGEQKFGRPTDAIAYHRDTGSTNFIASATYAAEKVLDGVLIDFGSTTTDIVAFRDGAPLISGVSDSQRLQTGELVYTGMTRTAVMAVSSRGFFRGQWQTLAREVLATMADVRRILGELPKGLDLHTTADGRSHSLEDSTARFARMFGRDKADGNQDDWFQAAAYIREVQIRSIQDELMRVLSNADLPIAAPVIAAGIGSDTARVLAQRIGRPVKDFGSIAHADKRVMRSATRSAPAVAIAHLVGQVAENG